MKPANLLRATAALTAIQGLAHGTLFLRARPRHGAAELALVEAMKSNRFDFSGLSRSYWDFYFGYGLESAAVCFFEAGQIALLAGMAQAQPRLARPMIALLLAANLGHALLTARYFFYLPVAFDLLVAALLGWAWLAGPTRGDQPASSASA
jgi:hypothetical protein